LHFIVAVLFVVCLSVLVIIRPVLADSVIYAMNDFN
jgi:hypothetical protein